VDDAPAGGVMKDEQLQQRQVAGEAENPGARRIVILDAIVDVPVFQCVKDVVARPLSLKRGGANLHTSIVTRKCLSGTPHPAPAPWQGRRVWPAGRLAMRRNPRTSLPQFTQHDQRISWYDKPSRALLQVINLPPWVGGTRPQKTSRPFAFPTKSGPTTRRTAAGSHLHSMEFGQFRRVV